MRTQQKTNRKPELLITKTRRVLQAAFLERLRAWTVWKLGQRGKIPLSPDLAVSLADADMELMAATKKLACVESCLDVELLWMNSAWVMYEAVRPSDSHAVIPWFPKGNYWIEYETPKQTPAGEMAALLLIDRSENSLQAISELLIEQATYRDPSGPLSSASIEAKVRDVKRHRQEHPPTAGSDLYEVSVVDTNGVIVWSVLLKLFAEQGRIGWTFDWGHHCPTGECDLLDQKLGEDAPGCNLCQYTFEYFQELLGITHSMLRGDFQETEQEAAEPESIVVTERLETENGEQTSKERVKHREHRMYVIRFDAAMKRLPSEARDKRGTWMSERPVVEDSWEADENAVIFVRMQFKAHDRTFRHERYTVARDTSRHFPSSVRPQQMTVREYRNRFQMGEVSDEGVFQSKQVLRTKHLRVEASTYEGKT